MSTGDTHRRCAEIARAWNVSVDRTTETETAVVAFGRRDDRPVVLKVVRSDSDERHAASVIRAFGGRGVVSLVAETDGAVLMERIEPGTPLAGLARAGSDDEATTIFASVIGSMSPAGAPQGTPTVGEWGTSFDRYLASGDDRLPRDLVTRAAREHADLASSQRLTRLLHGDLHHDNILYDATRGWLAIDPKGVVGEIEYEIGAFMRNPAGDPALYTTPDIIERRLARLVSALEVDASRAIRWTFAQAVLSAVWHIEDGHAVDAAEHGSLRLAQAMLSFIER